MGQGICFGLPFPWFLTGVLLLGCFVECHDLRLVGIDLHPGLFTPRLATWIISCSSCAFVDIRHRSSTYKIPPIHTLLPLCVMVACGNRCSSSCIKSATTMPNRIGLSLLPSCSPQTLILTISNLCRRACHIFPTLFRSCIVDSSPASWIWRFDLVPSWLSIRVPCCSVYCVSRLIIMLAKSFARALNKYIPM